MNVLIIEDEAPAARRLQKLLLETDPAINILSSVESIEAAVNWLNANPHPDLLFVDIQLADGLSFEIFNKVKILSPVIFTTAYDEYALKAFKVNSIDYLLKPIDSEELKKSFYKFRMLKERFSIGTQANGPSLDILIQQLMPEYKSRFLVKSGQRLIPVATEEIAYFYTEDKMVLINTFQNNIYTVDYTLDQLVGLLNKKEFFRINRQFILRINAIKGISSHLNGKLKIQATPPINGEIIVSREKSTEFKNWLDM